MINRSKSVIVFAMRATARTQMEDALRNAFVTKLLANYPRIASVRKGFISVVFDPSNGDTRRASFIESL